MMHLVGYSQSVDPGGAFVSLSAMLDPVSTVSGTDVLVPELNKLAGALAIVDKTATAQARLSSPSILSRGFQYYLSKLDDVGTRVGQDMLNDLFDNPIELTQLEALQFQINSDPASATRQYGFVWLSDGKVAPASGEIMTIRCTASITASAGAWVNGAINFPVSLKAGKYQIVGMRVEASGGIAARLVIPGLFWRPGVPCVVSDEQPDYSRFRMGNAGVFGEFQHSTPPTLDFCGSSGSSQIIYLDVIYVA